MAVRIKGVYLTPQEARLVTAALLATSRTGGTTRNSRLATKISEHYAIEQDDEMLALIVECANDCINDAAEAGEVERVK